MKMKKTDYVTEIWEGKTKKWRWLETQFTTWNPLSEKSKDIHANLLQTLIGSGQSYLVIVRDPPIV